MKKIAILTLVSNNQGNRLQNYAMQTVLERMGYRVSTLLRSKIGPIGRFKRYVRNLIINDQYTCFRKFNKAIKWSSLVVSPKFVSKQLCSEYDYIVIGSDQIWNPKIDSCSDCVYLPEIPADKKIAYAVSFGTTDISSEESERIVPLIRGFKNISCREESGTRFINEAANVKAVTVLDPVMLLSKGEWIRFEQKPEFIRNRKYVFRYILGDYKYDKLTENIGIRLGADIVDPKSEKIVIDPREFLYLIDHAELVLTDSFHGAVFSVLFGKKVFITERKDGKENMSCRLDTLCDLFHLKHIKVSCESEDEVLRNIDIMQEFYSCAEVNAVIETKREESLAFLKECLS